MSLIWLLACPADHPLKTSLEHYEEGRAALEAGRAEAAATSFREALAVHQDAAELELWLGRALAASGDLPGAIEAATRALELRGEWHLAHYNRACWRARSGELELAAADLMVALDGDLDPLVVAADPDLDPLRAHPDYRDLVPKHALPATVVAPEEAWFVGSEWTLTFEALEPEGGRVRVVGSAAGAAPLAHVRTVEDVVRHEGRQARRLQVVFRVLDAGEGSLGPWTLEAGELQAEVGPVSWRFLAPPDHAAEPVPVGQAPYALPSRLFDGLDEVAARRVEDAVLVRGAPGDTIRVEGSLFEVRYEVRDGGEPRWVGVRVSSSEPVTASVRRAGQELLGGSW